MRFSLDNFFYAKASSKHGCFFYSGIRPLRELVNKPRSATCARIPLAQKREIAYLFPRKNLNELGADLNIC
jgi:hypothetical protein